MVYFLKIAIFTVGYFFLSRCSSEKPATPQTNNTSNIIPIASGTPLPVLTTNTGTNIGGITQTATFTSPIPTTATSSSASGIILDKSACNTQGFYFDYTKNICCNIASGTVSSPTPSPSATTSGSSVTNSNTNTPKCDAVIKLAPFTCDLGPSGIGKLVTNPIFQTPITTEYTKLTTQGFQVDQCADVSPLKLKDNTNADILYKMYFTKTENNQISIRFLDITSAFIPNLNNLLGGSPLPSGFVLPSTIPSFQ